MGPSALGLTTLGKETRTRAGILGCSGSQVKLVLGRVASGEPTGSNGSTALPTSELLKKLTLSFPGAGGDEESLKLFIRLKERFLARRGGLRMTPASTLQQLARGSAMREDFE